MKVFLGGTYNNTTWREILMPMLDNKDIEYFNPVVDDWTEEDYLIEEQEKKICDICLYVLTPKMTGVYSVAEVVQDSNSRPEKTVIIILPTDGTDEFDVGQLKSLSKVGKIVVDNGARSYISLKGFVDDISQ